MTYNPHWLDKPRVRILSGPYAGKEGTVVNTPWLGNLWHYWMVVNIEGSRKGWWGGFQREWVTVYASQVTILPRNNLAFIRDTRLERMITLV